MIVALHEAHVAHCKSLGVGFSYGTPTAGHAKLGKRRLGYTEFTTLSLLRLDLNARLPVLGFLRGPLKRMYLKARAGRGTNPGPAIGGLRVNTLDSSADLDDRFDELWRRASPSQSVIAVRDASFLRWRYFERTAEKDGICLTASEHGVLVGYLVLVLKKKRSEQIGIVADAFSLRPEASWSDCCMPPWRFARPRRSTICWPERSPIWNSLALFGEPGLLFEKPGRSV